MGVRLSASLVWILATVALQPGPTQAREPEGVKLFKTNGEQYLRWSESKREIQSRIGPFLLCSGDPVERCVVPSDTWQPNFGQKKWSRYFRTSLDFWDDEDGTPQFFSYSIDMNSDLYEWVRDAFASALGSPTSSETSTVQNRMGATFDQESTSWIGATTAVHMVKRRSDRLTEGQVTVAFLPIARDIPEPSKGSAPF